MPCSSEGVEAEVYFMGWIPEPWWRIRHRRKRTSGVGTRLRSLSLRHRCAQSRALLLPLFSRLSQAVGQGGSGRARPSVAPAQ